MQVVLSLFADVVLVFHFGFIAFVVLGGIFALRWPKVMWGHIPVVLYGAGIEFIGATCPLTPLEKWLRQRGGGSGYTGGFIEHYLLPIVYPGGLTREVQLVLGVLVLMINAVIYSVVIRHYIRAR
jgi:hypothetical protein